MTAGLWMKQANTGLISDVIKKRRDRKAEKGLTASEAYVLHNSLTLRKKILQDHAVQEGHRIDAAIDTRAALVSAAQYTLAMDDLLHVKIILKFVKEVDESNTKLYQLAVKNQDDWGIEYTNEIKGRIRNIMVRMLKLIEEAKKTVNSCYDVTEGKIDFENLKERMFMTNNKFFNYFGERHDTKDTIRQEHHLDDQPQRFQKYIQEYERGFADVKKRKAFWIHVQTEGKHLEDFAEKAEKDIRHLFLNSAVLLLRSIRTILLNYRLLANARKKNWIEDSFFQHTHDNKMNVFSQMQRRLKDERTALNQVEALAKQ